MSVTYKYIFPIQAPQTGEEAKGEEEEEVLGEETTRRDQMVKGAIESLIREYSSELSASSQDAEAHQRKKRKEKKEVFLLSPWLPYRPSISSPVITT